MTLHIFQPGGPQPDILQWVYVFINSDDECTADYESVYDSKTMLCASAPVSIMSSFIQYNLLLHIYFEREKIHVKEILGDRFGLKMLMEENT